MRWSLYFAIIAVIFGGWNGSFPLDDAYITLHNARSILEGSDPLYRQPPLVGATSSVHLLLLAVVGLVLPLKLASFLLGLAAAGIYVAGLDRLLRQEGAAGWALVVLVSAGLMIGSVPLQLPNGLETGLAMAIVAWLLALRNSRGLPALAGLAPFVRPELAVLSALLLVRYARGRSAKDVGLAFLHAGLVALPWLLWIWFETGTLIPGTASAKVAFFAEAGLPLTTKLMMVIGACSLYLPLFIGLALGSDRWLRTGFVFSILFAAFLTLPGSLSWNYSRYISLLAPILLMGFASRRDPIIALLGIFSLVTGIWSIVTLQHAWLGLVDDENHLRRNLQYVPSNSVILVHDAGLIAWIRPDAKLVDIVGLKSPESAALHRRLTKQACHWQAALDEIGKETRASFAVVLQRPLWRCVGENLAQAGWDMEPAGSGRYQFYRITPRR